MGDNTEQDTPKRIQRRRIKGWRMPEGAIYVGRPTCFGNVYKIGEHYFDGVQEEWCVHDAESAVIYYREYLNWRQSFGAVPLNIRPYLTGHDLVCWCPLDKPCHADVLLEIANG